MNTKNTAEMISRETSTEAEWSAWWAVNYPTVMARATLALDTSGMAPQLLRLPCPVCGQSYLTSTSEREATCGDCLDQARRCAGEARDKAVRALAKRDADYRWAVQACSSGWCDHEGRDGEPFCYLAVFPGV